MTKQAKSNSWISRVSCSSGAIHLGRSDEAPARNALVPMPIFVLGFKSTGAALSRVINPARPAQAMSRKRLSPSEERSASERSREPSDPPVVATNAGNEAAQTLDLPAAPRQGDSIDLIIDKLPRHKLIKPIPVTIAPLGDRVFVASTPDLDITVTGNSLSDALLLLKQQLELTYESLRKNTSTKEQARQLQRLRDYIHDS